MAQATRSTREILWGLLPLAALPLTVLLLATFAPVSIHGEDRAEVLEAVFEIVRYDWLGPPTVLMTLLACLHASRVVMVSLRDRQVPGALALLPLLVPGALVLGVIDHELFCLLKPMSHDGQMAWDHALIYEAGDFLALRATALLIAGCGALLVALALLPTARGPERVARFAFLFSIAAVGTCFLVAANATMGARAAFVVAAFDSHGVRLDMLFPAIERWRNISQSASTLLLWALVLGLGASLRLASHGEGRAALGGLVMLALVAIAVRSGGAMDERLVKEKLAASHDFDGHVPYEHLPLTASASAIHKEVVAHHSWGGPEARLAFLVDRSDTASSMGRALTATRDEGEQRVRLSLPREPIAVPLIFEPVALLRANEHDIAELGVRFDDEPVCENFAAEQGTNRPELSCLDLGDARRRSPSDLVMAARAARANGHWPVVQVPRIPAAVK